MRQEEEGLPCPDLTIDLEDLWERGERGERGSGEGRTERGEGRGEGRERSLSLTLHSSAGTSRNHSLPSLSMSGALSSSLASSRSASLSSTSLTPSLTHSLSPSQSDIPPLEIQSIDFLGPADVMKKLFSLPHTQEQPYFALHKMGNTLLIDSLNNLEEDDEIKDEKMKRSKKTTENVKSSSYSVDKPMINSLIGDISAATAVADFCSKNHHEDDSPQGSPYIPPPAYFFPQHPPVLPFRNIFRWQLRDMKFALGSDLTVYSTPDRPALTVAPIDTTKDIPLMTCLDHYLDNVMANVPELALCLHAKGFLRGISVCGTEEIPNLRGILNLESPISGTIEGPGKSPSPKASKNQKPPLFDPQVIEFNALTILRFLKQNCTKENGTYIVHMTRKDNPTELGPSSPDTIQVYDLQAISVAHQKKWKWLLAMLCHRFATRLGHHYRIASPHSRVILRDRQLSLYQNCYDLLIQIRQLGGGNHGTICASVLEQIADIHLSRAETRLKGHSTSPKKAEKSKNFPDLRGGKKKKNRNKTTDNSVVDFFQNCETQVTTTEINFEHDYHDGELESIDYSAEIEKSMDLLFQAMSNIMDVMEAQLNTEEEFEPDSILIGDVACETLVPEGEGLDDIENVTPMNLTLLLQYSGVFHKATTSCISVVKNIFSSSMTKAGQSKLTSAIQILDRILPNCEQWISATSKAKNDLIALREKSVCNRNEKYESGAPHSEFMSLSEQLHEADSIDLFEENLQDLWSIDRTILGDLSNLWDVLGEVCREMKTTKPSLPLDGDFRSDDFIGVLTEWEGTLELIRKIISCFARLSLMASNSCVQVLSVDHVAIMWDMLSGGYSSADHNLLMTLKPLFFALASGIFEENLKLGGKVEESIIEMEIRITNSNVFLLKMQSFAFIVGILLSMRTDLGWSKAEWMNQSKIDGSISISQIFESKNIVQLFRHLGDACNELGQSLYRVVALLSSGNQSWEYDIPAESNIQKIHPLFGRVYQIFNQKIISVFDIADTCYSVSISIFTAISTSLDPKSKTYGSTIANLIAVRCNMSCLRRCLSSSLADMIIAAAKQSSDPSLLDLIQSQDSPILTSIPVERKGQSKIFTPLDYLDQAIEMCQESFDVIDSSIATALHISGASAILTIEMATNHMFKGLLYRKCLKSEISTISALLSGNTRCCEDSKIFIVHAIENLEKALSVFGAASNHGGSFKQIPAVHYHLGSLRAMLWASELQDETKIHESDINLEKSMTHYSCAHTYYLKYDVGPTLLLILTDMCEMYLHSFQIHESQLLVHLSTLKQATTPGIDKTELRNVVCHEVSSLLGGAFRVLIDCRFALTGVVLVRHGQQMIDSGIVDHVVKLLQKLLLRLIKYLNGNTFNPPEQILGMIKDIYRECLKPMEWKCSNKKEGKSQNANENSKDVRYLSDVLDRLNSCEWLKTIL